MTEEQKETMSNDEKQEVKKYTTIKMANGLELISMTEAAKMMGISRTTARNWMLSGELPPYDFRPSTKRGYWNVQKLMKFVGGKAKK